MPDNENTTTHLDVSTDLQVALVDRYMQENFSDVTMELIEETETKLRNVGGISSFEIAKHTLFAGVLNEMITIALREQIERMKNEGLLPEENPQQEFNFTFDQPTLDNWDPKDWDYMVDFATGAKA